MATLKKRTSSSPGTARRARRIVLIKKSAVISVAALIALSVIVYALRRPEININSVTVYGTNVIKTVQIENAVWSEMKGRYFYLIPKTSAFFYPNSSIVKSLREKFARIGELSVERAGFNLVTVRLTERPERYLWCGRDILDERIPDNECYFADSGGYVFSKAPYYSGHMFLEFYGPLSSGENSAPVGGMVENEDIFRKIVSFSEKTGEIPDLNLKPERVLVKTDGDLEFYLPNNGEILASRNNDLDKAADYLKTALSAEPLKTKISQNRDTLDYLDVRFGNKVYYKFK